MKYLPLLTIFGVVVLFMLSLNVSFAEPSPTPVPTPVKGFIDPCKLQTMSAAHAAWKAAHCN